MIIRIKCFNRHFFLALIAVKIPRHCEVRSNHVDCNEEQEIAPKEINKLAQIKIIVKTLTIVNKLDFHKP